MVACVPWLRARDKRRRVGLRTCRCRNVVCYLVQPQIHNSCGWSKFRNVLELGKGHSALHEFGPDWRCAVSAFELQIAVIIVANPNNTEQIGGITCKPGVVRGSRLPRRRHTEAASADSRGGPIIQNALQH